MMRFTKLICQKRSRIVLHVYSVLVPHNLNENDKNHRQFIGDPRNEKMSAAGLDLGFRTPTLKSFILLAHSLHLPLRLYIPG